jgi:hypothetical protein
VVSAAWRGRVRDGPDGWGHAAPADPAKARDVKLAAAATATYRDATLRITTPAGRKILGPAGALHITLHLPARSRLQARAAAAQLTTTGPLADITARSL